MTEQITVSPNPTISPLDVAGWYRYQANLRVAHLHWLMYYTEAWGLALLGSDIMPEIAFHLERLNRHELPTIQAISDRYGLPSEHAGNYYLPRETTAPHIAQPIRSILENMWERYGTLSDDQMEKGALEEKPVRLAKASRERGKSNVVSKEIMQDYYMRQIAVDDKP